MNPLSYWRSKSKLTVRKLADASGVSPTTINRLEKGHIKSSVLTLGKLADALGVDVTLLADLAEDPKPYALTAKSTRA